jgi:hypothetical protein
MTSSAHYTMIVFGLLIALLGCASTAQADSVTVYPVQSGLIADSSCCSPYFYSNNSSSTFAMTGCFDDYHYGCFQWRERGAWRWDLEGAVPENAVVTSAQVHWNHPNQCQAWNVYVWIDAGNQILSSSYCSQIRSNPDQQYSQQTYNASSASWSINESVLNEALGGGYLSLINQIGYDGQGCVLQSLGTDGVRIIIEYDLETCPGDFNGNNAVDVDDLLALINAYSTFNNIYDLDGNSYINVNDILILIGNYGDCE